MTKSQGRSAENDTQNPVENDGGQQINNGPVPNNTIIGGQRNGPVQIDTYNITGQLNNEPLPNYNDLVSNYTPMPYNTNIGGERKDVAVPNYNAPGGQQNNMPVPSSSASVQNYMPVLNNTSTGGQRNNMPVPNYNASIRNHMPVLDNTDTAGQPNKMPVPNYNVPVPNYTPVPNNTNNEGKPQTGTQYLIQEGRSAENNTQNSVGNNGGQQNNGPVLNNTNFGCKRKNAPVPNNTRKRSRTKKEPVPNSTSKGKTRTEIRSLIHEVKDAIENCMTKYVTKDQVAVILQRVKGFDPEVTKMVWDGLAASNPDYFKAYNARIVLCYQISKFNELLQQQANLMEKQRAESTASNFLAPPTRMNGNTPSGPPAVGTKPDGVGSPESVSNIPQSNNNDNIPDTSEGPDNGMMKTTKDNLQSPDLPQGNSGSTDGDSNAEVDSASISRPISDVVVGSNVGAAGSDSQAAGNPVRRGGSI